MPAFSSPRQLARYVLPVAWMCVIFLASADSQSGSHSGALVSSLVACLHWHPTPMQLEALNHWIRKGAHFTEYGILAGLWAWALPPGGAVVAIAWAMSAAYACTDELHQAFVPTRGPSPVDIGIDSAGAATALLLRAGLLAGWRRWGRAPNE